MPSLLYELKPIVLPGDGIAPMVETSRLELIGESEHDARSILALPSGEARSALDEAMDFLVAELGNGKQQEASNVRRAARSVGISDGTLDRARKRLGVQTAKAHFGGGWTMWLSKNPAGVVSSHGAELESSGDSAGAKGLRALAAAEESKSQEWILRVPSDPVEDELDHYRETLAKPVRPLIGDPGYLERIFSAFETGHIAESEWHQADRGPERGLTSFGV